MPSLWLLLNLIWVRVTVDSNRLRIIYKPQINSYSLSPYLMQATYVELLSHKNVWLKNEEWRNTGGVDVHQLNIQLVYFIAAFMNMQ